MNFADIAARLERLERNKESRLTGVEPLKSTLAKAKADFKAAREDDAKLAAEVPTPDAHFGFRMGANGRLATADAIEKYFEAVASQSDRVKIVDFGPTTEGHRTIAAIVSAPDNIRNLERIRAAIGISSP